MFLDDGFSLSVDFDNALLNSHQVKHDLILAGWVPNSEKSQWFPVQRIGWIGCVFDLVYGMIMVSDDKADRVIEKAEIICINLVINASFAGLVTSMYQAFGDIVYLMTRVCQVALAGATQEFMGCGCYYFTRNYYRD